MGAPPDLKVLCRRLTSTPVEDLPRLCPVLVSHVLRCGGPLSAPVDAKDKSSETPMLIHKLRTRITALLTGKSPAGRFAAVCLAKAAVDVGGWETLRASDPWLKGMLAMLQKPDPLASKELCIVTLTKIYMLLQGYQTLIREMATPTLPSYATACLQLIKPPASGKPLKVPLSFVDTVACSLSKLVVLYPTTLRPSAAAIKAALRPYIAPTSSDDTVVPQSLRESSRQLYILLSYTAPKNGSSDEWAKALRSYILDSQATLDQIFRAVVESWESSTGYRGQAAQDDAEPSGGGDSVDELPSWSGVQAGSERLVGLLEFLADYFNNPTKAPVMVPLGELLDLTARITLVTPPSGSEDSVETNPSISRDEKAELWSVLPDIHVAVLRLHQALIRRLRENAVPLATDILDQMVRVSNASKTIPTMRETAYVLAKELLLLAGPTLPKLTVDSLTPLIQSSCRDILLATGHLQPAPQQPPQPTTTTANNNNNKQPKQTTTPTNADAYTTPLPSHPHSTTLTTPETTAAHALLPHLLSHLPQSHLAPDLRSLLDRTAILAHSRDALVASCLHPYRDSRGRYYPSILPFLVRQFPRDQGVEVLRSNLLRVRGGEKAGQEWEEGGGLEGLLSEGGKEEEEEDVVVDGEAKEEKPKPTTPAKPVTSGWGVTDAMDVDAADATPTAAANDNPFAAVVVTDRAKPDETSPSAVPLKRKNEGTEPEADVAKPPPAKRVDTGAAPKVAVVSAPAADGDSEDESDSEGSVQIDMTLDDDEEEEEDDDDEEDE